MTDCTVFGLWLVLFLLLPCLPAIVLQLLADAQRRHNLNRRERMK